MDHSVVDKCVLITSNIFFSSSLHLFASCAFYLQWEICSTISFTHRGQVPNTQPLLVSLFIDTTLLHWLVEFWVKPKMRSFSSYQWQWWLLPWPLLLLCKGKCVWLKICRQLQALHTQDQISFSTRLFSPPWSLQNEPLAWTTLNWQAGAPCSPVNTTTPSPNLPSIIHCTT